MTNGFTASKPPFEHSDPKPRKCLGHNCGGKMFMSEWIGERICKSCKDTAGFNSSSIDDTSHRVILR